MKKYSLVILLFTAFACTNEKDVELSTIDVLTGGFEREWKFVEWEVNNENLLLEECFLDDTAIFSKGDPRSDADSLQKSTYTWKRNVNHCGLLDADEVYKLTLSDDGMYLSLNQEKFFIEHITNTELTLVHTNPASPQIIKYIALDISNKVTPVEGI